MFKLIIPTLIVAISLNLVQSEVHRLPNTIKPERYILTIEPNVTFNTSIYYYYDSDPITFWGDITIELEVLENTDNITIHAKNLKIKTSNIDITDTDGAKTGVKDTLVNDEDEVVVIHLESELVKGGRYNLTINRFSGQSKFSGTGLFLALYPKDDTFFDYHVVAVTHFEPTFARTVFPCFDEPALKANFIINIIREKGYVSLSNEELESTEDLENGLFKDRFKETPKMSSYLVAFAVSNFKSTPKVDRHRIYAQSKDIDSGALDYPLEISVKTLQELEKFTGVKFALSKIDQFAVPVGYFRHNAMENWGMVIYGEEYLKCTNRTSTARIQKIVTYISHEFAHQWFGNLVTPTSWDYIWISESFAAYFQYYISSLVEPTWRIMDQFLISVVQTSFNEEHYAGAHPLNYHIEKYGEFPPFHIMYEKGSTIVRMMSHFLSQEIFQQGLHDYFEERKFGTAEPSDLYRKFQEAVDKAGANHLLGNLKVADIMGTWDSMKGFPIVTVTRNYSTGAITFNQTSKFTQNEGANQLWKIPINYIFSCDDKSDFLNTTADVWLTEEQMTVNNNFTTDGWLLVNKQQTGYYRVNYDLENWERIIQFLKSDKFESIQLLTRAQLLNDAFYLAYYNELPVEIPLRLSEYLVREKDYIPFAGFFSGISNNLGIYHGHTKDDESKYFLNHPLSNQVASEDENSQVYSIFQEFIRVIMKNIRDHLGHREKPTDSYLDKITRREIDRYFPYYFKDRPFF